MREIATLQLGSYANFVGAHFWNFQDELAGLAADMEADGVYHQQSIDTDVLYSSSDSRQPTYTPRLVCVDLRGSLGAAGSFYHGQDVVPAVSSWTGPVASHRAEAYEKNVFLQRLEAEEAGESTLLEDEAVVSSLETSVHTWADYLKVHLHPRSVYEIQGVWSGVTPFDDFGSGKGLLAGTSGEELQDRFRLVLEECDHLQGIQTLVDDSGGFAGVASDVLLELEDNYGRIPMMLFTVRPPQDPDLALLSSRLLHDAVSFSSLAAFGDVLVPTGLPQLASSPFARYLEIDDAKPFYTSAVYATALHALSLPFRMLPTPTQVGSCDMRTLCTNLSYAGRKIARLESSLPAPPVSERAAISGLGFSSLTPDVAHDFAGDNHAAESTVMHGPRLDGCQGPAPLSTVLDWLHSRRSKLKVMLSHWACSPCPLPVPLPFPRIFGGAINRHGDITPSSSRSTTVVSVPVATRLVSDSGIVSYLVSRRDNLEQLGLRKHDAVLDSWGITREDAEQHGDFLDSLVRTFT